MADQPQLIRVHPSDNVAVAITDIAAGSQIRLGDRLLVVRDTIPRGHKVAAAAIARGQVTIKYGFPIGESTADIEPGRLVHTHNLKSRLQGIDTYEYHPADQPEAGSCVPSLVFDGYERPDGTVGIRNEIWIIPTVGCVNEVCQALARKAQTRFAGPGLDGVFAFEHPYGCSQLGDDLSNTQRLLAGLVGHPNAAGVLVVGLGCENNNLVEFQKVLGPVAPERVRFLPSQEVQDECQAGLELIGRIAEYARTFRRRAVPVSKLVVALKCGGSDGFSGITANPLLGSLSDRLVRLGGTTLLTEVPEMFGAEEVLLGRCTSRAVFDKCVAMIDDFKAYYLKHGQRLDENPSPGNRQGGITTLEEKSLGCVQKGGTSPVVDVLAYGQRVSRAGLNLLSAPGNDIISVTALAAAGAQIVLFTTGRGTPLGGPVPTLKVSTTSELARRKPGWIDFDAGPLLAGESMPAMTDRLFDDVLQVASGRRRTKNEQNDDRQIAIFKDGVTL